MKMIRITLSVDKLENYFGNVCFSGEITVSDARLSPSAPGEAHGLTLSSPPGSTMSGSLCSPLVDAQLTAVALRGARQEGLRMCVCPLAALPPPLSAPAFLGAGLPGAQLHVSLSAPSPFLHISRRLGRKKQRPWTSPVPFAFTSVLRVSLICSWKVINCCPFHRR